MEYKSRSVRLDDETWEALRTHPLSANQLLRVALGLTAIGSIAPIHRDASLPAATLAAKMLNQEPPMTLGTGETVQPNGDGTYRGKAKRTKREKAIEERAAGDITAQRTGRDDIDYSDLDSTPTTHVTNLDATGPPVSAGRGKVSMEEWRASRKPLSKPKDRKI